MYFFYKFIDLPLQFCYNGENTGKEAPRVTDRQIRCFLALYETPVSYTHLTLPTT